MSIDLEKERHDFLKKWRKDHGLSDSDFSDSQLLRYFGLQFSGWKSCAESKQIEIDDLKSQLSQNETDYLLSSEANKAQLEQSIKQLKSGETMQAYKQSNRYKLNQAVKATGFKQTELSLTSSKSRYFFKDQYAQSKFLARGDISEKRLNELLTTLLYAERELLGVSAKEVPCEEALEADSNNDGIFAWAFLIFVMIVGVAYYLKVTYGN